MFETEYIQCFDDDDASWLWHVPIKKTWTLHNWVVRLTKQSYIKVFQEWGIKDISVYTEALGCLYLTHCFAMDNRQWNLVDTTLCNTFFGIHIYFPQIIRFGWIIREMIRFSNDTLYFPVPVKIESTRLHCICHSSSRVTFWKHCATNQTHGTGYSKEISGW